jgi:hypothetical protein
LYLSNVILAKILIFVSITRFMIRALTVLVGFLLLFGACTQKMICPAYQSAYIYDKNELRKKYSYFNEDSTPKVLTASKTKYLIAVPESYRKKVRGLQTVPMKRIQPIVPDSLMGEKKEPFGEDDFSLAERDFADSTSLDTQEVQQDSVAQDSIYVITKDKEIRVLRYNFPDSLKYDPETGRYVPEKPYYYVQHIGYNTEQDNYMWYLRDVLVLPDVRLAQLGGSGSESAGKSKEKKGIKGFFKNLFKKKDKKKEKESLVEEEVEEEQEKELDFSDLDNPPQDNAEVGADKLNTPEATKNKTKEKKGLFKKKEKAPKKKKEATAPVKKEEEDDGF